MNKFEFYDHFKSLEAMKDVTFEDKRILDLIRVKEECLGHRTIGKRNYHIFYLKDRGFAVYYHGGGVDAMYTSKTLGDTLNYVNTLEA